MIWHLFSVCLSTGFSHFCHFFTAEAQNVNLGFNLLTVSSGRKSLEYHWEKEMVLALSDHSTFLFHSAALLLLSDSACSFLHPPPFFLLHLTPDELLQRCISLYFSYFFLSHAQTTNFKGHIPSHSLAVLPWTQFPVSCIDGKNTLTASFMLTSPINNWSYFEENIPVQTLKVKEDKEWLTELSAWLCVAFGLAFKALLGLGTTLILLLLISLQVYWNILRYLELPLSDLNVTRWTVLIKQ